MVRMQLHHQGYSSNTESFFSSRYKTNNPSRAQSVEVLETVHAQLSARDKYTDGMNSDVVEGLITKLMQDNDWKISDAMLETRFARLC